MIYNIYIIQSIESMETYRNKWNHRKYANLKYIEQYGKS